MALNGLQLVTFLGLVAVAAATDYPPTCEQVFEDVTNTCLDCDNANVVSGTFTDFSTESPGYLDTIVGTCDTVSDCCRECKNTSGCEFFVFGNLIDDQELADSPSDSPAPGPGADDDEEDIGGDATICKLFGGAGTCGEREFETGAPFVTGGYCNPGCSNDPHFVGAQGVKYDFNGVPGKTFCLVTDPNIHINIRLSGYYSPDADGVETIRSWIREIVYFWRAAGESYTLQLIARSGKETARKSGFMEAIIFNGQPLKRFGLKDKFVHERSGLELTLKAYESLGNFQVDFYHVSISNLIEADVRLRVAHPKLQLPNDAETHLNLNIRDIDITDDAHGVLGQTYRKDRTEVTAHFKKLVAQLRGPIKADGASGEGFLDGSMLDYETPDVLSTACKFDRYNPALTVSVSDD